LTVGEALRAAEAYLDRKGVPRARVDAELLLAQALGLTRLELYTHSDQPLTETERDAGRAVLERRAGREPLAYILGGWGFRRLTLKTDPRALVPRPETETVVERCLARLAGSSGPRVVDVGTGSGAIALALASELPTAAVTATDLSSDALALAGENAAELGLTVDFRQTSLLDGLDGPYDLVVSNPPYVLAAELDGLEPEVRDWEPRLALVDAGQTEALADDARRVLDGWLVLEVHEARAREIADLLAGLGYADVETSLDLAGRERVVEGRWQPRR
jgi:release factor glutamine methyltransferase